MEDPVVPLERNLYGHPLAGLLCERQFEKNLVEVRLGEGFQLGMLIRSPWKRIILICVCGWHKIGWKETKYWSDEESKEVDLGEPTSFLDHVYLGFTQRQCEISKDIVDNYRTMFESRISAGATEKITMPGKCAYFFVVIWHGGPCQEMCGTILWVGKQDDTTTLQSINSMLWWPSFQRRTIEIRGRIVKSMLSNCSEILILGTYWKTWYSMVSEQTCTIDHKMDKSLWQKIMSFDLLHSSYMSTNSIAMWETLPNNADWDCFKTPILQEIFRIQNLHQVEYCAFFGKSYVCSNQLDVQETNFSFAQFNRIRNHFFWTQDWGWMVSPQLIYGIWSSQFLETRITVIKNGETFVRTLREVRSTPHKLQKRKQSHGMINDLDNVDFYLFPQTSTLLIRKLCCMCLKTNEAVIKMIIKGRSPTMRHVSRTHRGALDWLFDRINLDSKNPNKNTLTPKTISQTYWPREIPHVMKGIIFCVCQHQPFQFHQVSWSDVEKNTRRCRWRKSHSKIEANHEFSLAMQRKVSWRACLYCIRKPGENQIWKSNISELMEWAASKNRETCFGRLFIKLLRVECWQELVFSRVEIWWNVGSKNRETCLRTTTRFVLSAHGQTYCWWRWYGLQHRRRIRHAVKVTIILAQGEWSSAKDARPILKKCNERQWQTLMSSTLEASVFMGKNYLDNLHSIKNTGKDLTMKQMFEISEKLITEQSDEILWNEYN